MAKKGFYHNRPPKYLPADKALPNRCPTCHKPFTYETDGLGRVVAMHAMSRCVAPPIVPFGDDEEAAA